MSRLVVGIPPQQCSRPGSVSSGKAQAHLEHFAKPLPAAGPAVLSREGEEGGGRQPALQLLLPSCHLMDPAKLSFPQICLLDALQGAESR